VYHATIHSVNDQIRLALPYYLVAICLSFQLADPKKPTLLMNQRCSLRKATGFHFTHKDDVIAFWVLAAVATFKPRQSALENGQA
jgi:hypothetical protein